MKEVGTLVLNMLEGNNTETNKDDFINLLKVYNSGINLIKNNINVLVKFVGK